MALSRTNTPESRRELALDDRQSRRERLVHAARLITAYWQSSEWKMAWFLLTFNLAVSFYAIHLSISLTDWNRRLFDAIGVRDATALPALMVEYAWLMAVIVATPIVTGYMGYQLRMRWRLWLTREYMDRWLAAGRYHEIERVRVIDNPDQRITEDTRAVAEQVFNLFTAITSNVVEAIAFAVVLYGLSVPVRLALFGVGIDVQGDIVIYAVAAAGIGTCLIGVIARPLVRRSMRQQHLDADLRFGLGNIRRNAEQIAFLRAAPFERQGLLDVIVDIRRNYTQYIYAALGLQAGQSVYGRLVAILPLVVLLPRYMAGRMSLGQYTQAGLAFTNMVGSLSILVQVYQGIAEQIAVVNRLKALDDAIANPRPQRIAIGHSDDGSVRADALEIQLPDGSHLLTVDAWHVARGERWIVTGSSGSGKSTLLRALAGLWPDGTGAVALPGDGLVMFVPQRLYLPIGQLKDAVNFPQPAHDFDDARVVELLELCRLGHLVDRLHLADVWQDRLSPGEQQRLALVRVLLHRPDYLLIDEATSALDEDNAAHFYATLAECLPDATIVSVTHAPTLERFHDHALRIAGGLATTLPPTEKIVHV